MMKYYAGFALAAVSTFLRCGELGCSGEIGLEGPLPRNCELQTRLELQPQNDRVIVRVINVSSDAQHLDMRTVHLHEINFKAFKESERPRKEEEEKVKVVEEKLITMGPHGGYNETDDSIDTVLMYHSQYDNVQNNPVFLPSGAFIGTYIRSVNIAIFKPLMSAVLREGRDRFWVFGYALSPQKPGPDGRPVCDHLTLSCNHIRLTGDMIYKILAARQIVDLEEKKMKCEESPKDIDRFRLYLNLAPDIDALMADVVCVNPQPGKGEPPTCPPHERQIHIKTLFTGSWQWHVEAGYVTLYESQQTESIDSSDYSKPGNTPRLREGQLVGRIVQFSNSPGFVAVKEFFDKNKAKTAKCVIRLKLKLYVPDNDGKPREAGELISNGVVITQQDYQRICSLRGSESGAK